MKISPLTRQSLALLPHSAVSPIFIARHSLRNDPDNPYVGYDVGLTPEGEQLALALGRAFQDAGWNVGNALASASVRCVVTAERIIEGNWGEAQAMNVQPSSTLIEPGSYVIEPDKVRAVFRDEGPLGLTNAYLSGGLSGVLPLQAKGEHILTAIAAHNQGNTLTDQLTLAITHDTVLAAFVYGYLGRSSITQSDWPDMMEGAFVWFDEHNMHLIWRARVYTLAHSHLSLS